MLPESLINEILTDVVEMYLKPKFIELGMNASGQWLRSLEVRASLNRGEIRGMDYTKYLANGRGKNKDQSEEGINHFTRWAGHYIFKPWAEAKGISINPYAVARKIAKEGTESYPDGTDLLEVLNSREVMEFINSRIEEYVIKDAKLRFERIFKETLITV